jgi:hypothetical protein
VHGKVLAEHAVGRRQGSDRRAYQCGCVSANLPGVLVRKSRSVRQRDEILEPYGVSHDGMRPSGSQIIADGVVHPKNARKCLSTSAGASSAR